MPNLIYTEGLPNPPNLPSQDVNAMNRNNDSVNRIFVSVTNPTLDNIGFNNNDGGFHRQVSMKNQAVNPGLQGQDGVLFARANGTLSAPFWQNGPGVNDVYQLSGSASANNPSATANGYSFLPGGMIMQWGNHVNASNLDTITFPIPFINNCFVVNVTANRATPSGSQPTAIITSNITLIDFICAVSNNIGHIITNLGWIAIGN